MCPLGPFLLVQSHILCLPELLDNEPKFLEGAITTHIFMHNKSSVSYIFVRGCLREFPGIVKCYNSKEAITTYTQKLVVSNRKETVVGLYVSDVWMPSLTVNCVMINCTDSRCVIIKLVWPLKINVCTQATDFRILL